jgi:hypothetical protein
MAKMDKGTKLAGGVFLIIVGGYVISRWQTTLGVIAGALLIAGGVYTITQK